MADASDVEFPPCDISNATDLFIGLDGPPDITVVLGPDGGALYAGEDTIHIPLREADSDETATFTFGADGIFRWTDDDA